MSFSLLFYCSDLKDTNFVTGETQQLWKIATIILHLSSIVWLVKMLSVLQSHSKEWEKKFNIQVIWTDLHLKKLLVNIRGNIVIKKPQHPLLAKPLTIL